MAAGGPIWGGAASRDRGAVPHPLPDDPVTGKVLGEIGELKGESRHIWKAIEDLALRLRAQNDELNARIRSQADDIKAALQRHIDEHNKFRIDVYDRLGKLEHWKTGIVACFCLVLLLGGFLTWVAGELAESKVRKVVEKQTAADHETYEGMRETFHSHMKRIDELEEALKKATEEVRATQEKRRR